MRLSRSICRHVDKLAVEAARLRLRPILMTSLAFIFGVVPMVWATGTGAELRQTLGTAVFSGMIGVTAFGLIFTPAFYVICRWLATLGPKATPARWRFRSRLNDEVPKVPEFHNAPCLLGISPNI
jgi:AcrB/AcrD/AcrF family